MAGNFNKSEAELVKRIKEKLPDFSISIKDLKVPSSDFVVCYYTRVLEDFSTNVPYLFQSNVLSFHNSKIHVQNFVNIIPLNNLFKALRTVFQQIYIYDLTMFDLINPTAKRTFKHVEVFDNFHTFAHMTAMSLNVKTENLCDHKEWQSQFEEQKELAISDLNQKASERGKREDAIKQLEITVAERKATVFHLQRRKTLVAKDLTKVVSKKYEKDHKLEVVQNMLIELDRNIAADQRQVVQSPEQLALELQRGKDNYKALKETLKHNDIALKVKEEQLSTYKQIVTKPEVCHTDLKESVALYPNLGEVETASETMQKEEVMLVSQTKGILENIEKESVLMDEVKKTHNEFNNERETRIQELEDSKLKHKMSKKKQEEDNCHLRSKEDEVLQYTNLKQEEFELLEEKIDTYKLKVKKTMENLQKYIANAEAYLTRDIARLSDLEKKK